MKEENIIENKLLIEIKSASKYDLILNWFYHKKKPCIITVELVYIHTHTYMSMSGIEKKVFFNKQ